MIFEKDLMDVEFPIPLDANSASDDDDSMHSESLAAVVPRIDVMDGWMG